MRRLLPMLVLVQGCAPPTSMMVEFTTNLPCPSQRTAQYLGVAFGSNEDAVETTFTEVFDGRQCDDQTGVLGTYAFRPATNDREQTIFLRAALAPAGDVEAFCSPKEASFDARRCVIARRRIRFTPGATLRVPLLFHDSCLGKPCDVNETCVVGGRCVSKNLITPTCRPNESCVVELDAGVVGGGNAGGGSAAGGSAGGGSASGGSAAGGSASGGSASGGSAAGGSAAGGSASGGAASGGSAAGGSASGGSASGGSAAGGSASGGSAAGGSASGGSAAGGSASGGSAAGGSTSGGSAAGGSASGGSAAGGSASGGSAAGGSASGGSASGGSAAGGSAAGGSAAGGSAAGGSAAGGSAAGGSAGGTVGASGGSAGGGSTGGGTSDAGVPVDCLVYQDQFCDGVGCCLRSDVDAGLGSCSATCAPSGTSSGLRVGCIESADCPDQPNSCWVRNNASICLPGPTNGTDRRTCSATELCAGLAMPNCRADRVFPFLRTCQCDPLVPTCPMDDVCSPATRQCVPRGPVSFPGSDCRPAPPGQASTVCLSNLVCCLTTIDQCLNEPDPCPGVKVGCRTSTDCPAGTWCSYDQLTQPISARCVNGIEAKEACRPNMSSARNCEGGGVCTEFLVITIGGNDSRFGSCQ